jgi:SAM-dependent methyltransferase
VLEELRRRYRWAESQHVRVRDGDPQGAVAEVCGLLEAESVLPAEPGRTKAVHRAQKMVLGPQFETARGERAADVPFEVLEVGSGSGRWVPSFDPATTLYFGVDNEEALSAARADFPEARFSGLGPELLIPHEDERFDLVFCVDVLRDHPPAEKKTLLSEMWRVARPGGRVLFLEDFVFNRSEEGVYPISVNAFVGLLLEATNGQVVLEHVESLRYPREDVTRSAVIAVSRLGVPKKW